MVGEIRDKDTAEIATRAALTGHLVLSTLHTNNTIATITRLVDVGLEPYLIASSVTGILAQRLVRRICVSCKSEIEAPEAAQKLNAAPVERFYAGRGCPACKYTGYLGRVGVYEILLLSRTMKKLIIQERPEEELLALAREEGMITLFEDAWSKVRAGLTTFEEVLSKIPLHEES
jgi:type II secretory ATPase GspE/PulE/Tfp pilus assembly ATPase PilB-like protein